MSETWICTTCSKRHDSKAAADFCHPLPGSDDGYDVLRRVLARAVEQASAGKGRERHAHDEPFDQQKIVLLAKWSGGPAFDVGQACKKALESTRLPKERAVAELLGAINYLAAAVILLEAAPEPKPYAPMTDDEFAKVREEVTPKPRPTTTFAATRCGAAGSEPDTNCVLGKGHAAPHEYGYTCVTHGTGCSMETNVCRRLQNLCGELGPWSAVAGGRGCDKSRGHDGLHRVQTTHEGQAASW